MIKRKNKILILLFNFLLVSSLFFTIFSSGVAAADYPLEYKDNLGRKIVLKDEVERIISLAPAVTEIIYKLGAEEKLVAVSSACNYPQEALKKESIGRIDEPNIEKIISLEPDLVIAASITRIESLNRLSRLGITNIGFKPESINDTINMIKDISSLISAEKRGQELTLELENEYQSLKRLVQKKLQSQERQRVFYEVWANPLYTAGKNTFIDALIYEAGGYNIGREAKGSWPTFSLESLIAADPEVYISTGHSNGALETGKNLKRKALLREVSAFKNNRLYQVNQDLVNRPSPRIVKGYAELIKAIFPELKAEID